MKTPYELFYRETLPGWDKLIDPLVQRCKEEGVEILQIKEKWGGLCFYVGGCSDELLDAIDEVVEASLRTCEQCGEPGRPRGKGWIKTLCDEHADPGHY